MPIRLEHVLARNVARLRDERGWTQVEMARQMRLGGMNWTPNLVSQIETLRRPVGLLDVAVLAWVFGARPSALLDGDDEIQLELADQVVPLADIRMALYGWSVDYKRTNAERVDEGPQVVRRDELAKLARRLGTDADELCRIADQAFGHDLFEERDRRTGDVTAMSPNSVRTKRGHVTRALLAELREFIRR